MGNYLITIQIEDDGLRIKVNTPGPHSIIDAKIQDINTLKIFINDMKTQMADLLNVDP